MLGGWMPGRWALAGGALALVHHLTLLWSQSYWGGLVAVLGGALTVGAFRRIVRRPRARHAVALGVGLGILANSRPFEGLVLSLPFLVALGIWLARTRGLRSPAAGRRVLLPLAGVLAVAASGMLYFNFRVTGDALTTPYFVYERTYASTPPFVFQEPFRPAPSGEPTHVPDRTLTGLGARIRERAEEQARVFAGSLLVVAGAVVLLPLERSRWQHLAVLSLAVFVAGLGLPTWLWSHYAAPAAGLALLLIVQALRRVAAWSPGELRLGRPVAQALWLFMVAALAFWSWDTTRPWRDPAPTSGPSRATLLASLGQRDGKHLVIVRRGTPDDPVAPWVYNGADIDAAPVVWARELDDEANAGLIDYFKDRRVWLLEAGRAGLRPYPGPRSGGTVSGG
jgi:hypothetical protein